MTVDPVLTWAFLGVGVFALGFALMLALRPLRQWRAGGKAQGTITRNDEQVISSGRGSPRTYYLPEIAFTTAKGERITIKSPTGGRVALPPGTAVSMIYDPANPHEALVNSFGSLWFFPLVLCVCGLPFLAVGLIGAFS